MDDERGVVRWRIRDGLLVASEGREGDGYLEIEVDRCPEPAPGRSRMHVEVEIASFYPMLGLRLPRWLYANTQSRIHVLVTHGFLRSLARLELEESAVGRFATQGPAGEPASGNGAGPRAQRRRDGRRYAVAGDRRARRGPRARPRRGAQ